MKNQGFMLVFFAVILLWAYPVPTLVRAGAPKHQDKSSADSSKDSSDSDSGSGSGSSDHSGEDHSSKQHAAETKTQQQPAKPCKPSVYDYTVKDVDGKDVSLNKYKGRVLIIVNYADYCGFTKSNMDILTKWANKYGKDGLSILIFPSNSFLQNFGGVSVAKRLDNDHPELDVFSPISVNGFYGVDPLYVYLKESLASQATLVTTIKWNFTKFLVDRNGQPVNRYSPQEDYGNIETRITELIVEKPSN